MNDTLRIPNENDDAKVTGRGNRASNNKPHSSQHPSPPVLLARTTRKPLA